MLEWNWVESKMILHIGSSIRMKYVQITIKCRFRLFARNGFISMHTHFRGRERVCETEKVLEGQILVRFLSTFDIGTCVCRSVGWPVCQKYIFVLFSVYRLQERFLWFELVPVSDECGYHLNANAKSSASEFMDTSHAVTRMEWYNLCVASISRWWWHDVCVCWPGRPITYIHVICIHCDPIQISDLYTQNYWISIECMFLFRSFDIYATSMFATNKICRPRTYGKYIWNQSLQSGGDTTTNNGCYANYHLLPFFFLLFWIDNVPLAQWHGISLWNGVINQSY